MNNAEAREWLEAEWERVLEEGASDPDPEIDRFVNSKTVALRYAFVTQLLGRVTDERRGLLYLQAGAHEEGAWNARSFATSVIVPWVAQNHGVLGTSPDPYVSKPLRRLQLTRDMPDVKNRHEWRALVVFFEALEAGGTEAVREAFERCLRSLARRLAQQSFKYQVPKRVSIEDLVEILGSFLDDPSNGLRPLAVSTALMDVLGRAFSLFSNVKSQGLNEADRAAAVPGDIMCYGDVGEISLVVEVKDRELTIADLRDSVRKTREAGEDLSNLLFAVPGIRGRDAGELDAGIRSAWASGLNVHRTDIGTLVRAAFALLGEEWRTTFLKRTGEELDKRGDYEHRKAWHDLLSGIG